ncbi:adhesion G-protein coupled receptor G1-like [Plectropomus leopardus]|uniref:adhesion G-protein coupled receptor G1-like n=1 Tax=Plectropomus leopardus TaxID=160734 RepID=UPI001C4AB85C|nr:adhesion G-protein coupled receptor G1-like [Plectropomus leopardus]
MWISLLLVTQWFSTTQAGGWCENAIDNCQKYGDDEPWTRCYEDSIGSCTLRSRVKTDFVVLLVNSSQEAEVSPTGDHRVYIPSSALKRSTRARSTAMVRLVVTVINSTYFERKGHASQFIPDQPVSLNGIVMGGWVLVVKAGHSPVQNLPEPIKLTFKHNKQVENGQCVFWKDLEDDKGTADWSKDGCETWNNGAEFICSCNHLSFFAVLVNPEISVDESEAMNLSYITYSGSALSIFLLIISLIIYIYLQRRRPEKAISVHLQLTGALLCLHLSFLLCSFWVWQLKDNEEDWVCQGLGLLLHWSLQATFSWTALEGFHLYLLLVRVFNIYVRRYLLKLSLVGWGLPTMIAVVCGILGVYGKYSLPSKDANVTSSTMQMCWISSQSQQRLLISYITTVAFPCLVILCNSCMLGLVVFKLWQVRAGSGGTGSSNSWKKMNKEKGIKLWKDCATVLGLSCMLGLPWVLLSTTYISILGIYIFTILNSLQGLFMFLWSVALIYKSRSDNNSLTRDPSSQKVMTTSFNN